MVDINSINSCGQVIIHRILSYVTCKHEHLTLSLNAGKHHVPRLKSQPPVTCMPDPLNHHRGRVS